MNGLNSDPLFVAMTRPTMLAGVPFGFVIGNVILMLELFLIFRTPLVLVAGIIVHAIGWLGCLREPRLIDLWMVRLRRCPRVKNHRFWQCNSYRP
ncbi:MULTISPECIES: VirB3 family type IV secretion system protein [unclassified Sphingomonas]|uniref:type IV secretion system protein VirB3 n=1 Tax=unclassified Sphingomonas TaxID=196159 RepID=UPI001F55E9EB